MHCWILVLEAGNAMMHLDNAVPLLKKQKLWYLDEGAMIFACFCESCDSKTFDAYQAFSCVLHGTRRLLALFPRYAIIVLMMMVRWCAFFIVTFPCCYVNRICNSSFSLFLDWIIFRLLWGDEHMLAVRFYLAVARRMGGLFERTDQRTTSFIDLGSRGVIPSRRKSSDIEMSSCTWRWS